MAGILVLAGENPGAWSVGPCCGVTVGGRLPWAWPPAPVDGSAPVRLLGCVRSDASSP